MELPYSDRIIGNPDTGVIHGGAITTLMDTASGSVMICGLDEFELCPTLDLRVDYMRPAEPPRKPVYARAETYKITRNIIFTRCEAYQEGGVKPSPIAWHLHAHWQRSHAEILSRPDHRR